MEVSEEEVLCGENAGAGLFAELGFDDWASACESDRAGSDRVATRPPVTWVEDSARSHGRQRGRFGRRERADQRRPALEREVDALMDCLAATGVRRLPR